MKYNIVTVLFIICVLSVYSYADDTIVKNYKVVDLTHTLHNDIVYWPGGVPFTIERLVDYDQGYRLHKFTTGENTGTHVDAPSHFVKGKKSLSDIDAKDLVALVVVIDVVDKVKNNDDYQITKDDIISWEKRHGKIPRNSVVLAYTGWSKNFSTPEKYINFDSDKVMRFPGYSADAADVLIARRILGVGIDTLSLDNGSSTTFEFHRKILKKNIYQLENLNNLDALPATGATIVVGVLPIENGSQAQARILAFVKKQ